MIIRCPKCNEEIELGVSKFPPTGIEVTCPSCSAKFKMRSKGRAKLTSEDGAKSEAPPPAPPAPAPPAPAPPAPAAAAADDFDPLDGLGDLFDELDQLSVDEPAESLYFVRSQMGKVFGPLNAEAIEKMLQTDQLTGGESLSLDQQEWKPMNQWEPFGHVQPKAAPVDDEDDDVEWEESAHDPAPAAPARAQVTPAPARPQVTPAARPQAAPAAAEPLADPSAPVEVSAEPFPTINRSEPRRIRSALKDEILEEEPAGPFNIKDPKIIGGGVFAIVLLLGAIVYVLLSPPSSSKPSFGKIQISFKKPYAKDSHRIYLRQLLPQIQRKLRKQPGHPGLLTYKALTLAMYLEHHRPDRPRERQFKGTFKKIPPPVAGKPLSFHYLWLLAQRAVLQRKALKVLRLSKLMLKRRPGHTGALYLIGKAYALSGRHKGALKHYDKVLGQMSEPARVHYAKGLSLARKKRKQRKKRKKRKKPPLKKKAKGSKKGKTKAPKARRPAPPRRRPMARPAAPRAAPLSAAHRARLEDAFQAFYKATLITKEHYPAYLALLDLEKALPEHKIKYAKARKDAGAIIAKIKNRGFKSKFYLLRFRQEKQKGDHQRALSWLLLAFKYNKSKKVKALLPEAYLATHNYAKIWSYIEKKMKKKPGVRKRKYKLKDSLVFLQVLFRLNKIEDARPWPRRLVKHCKKCKDSDRFWYWAGRLQEALKNNDISVRNYGRALAINPKRYAAIAGRGRYQLHIKNDKGAKPYAAKLEGVKATELIDQLSMMEFWLMLGKSQAVIDLGKRVLQKHSSDAFLQRLVGQAYMLQKKPARAHKYFKAALSTHPKDLHAIRGLGMSLLDLQRDKEALALFEKFMEVNKEDGQVLYLTGRIHYHNKNYKKAIELLKKSIELSDKSAAAHYYLARAYDDSKSLNPRESYKIRDAYDRATQLEPKNRRYLYGLARYYHKNRKARKALAIYTKMLRAKQDDVQRSEVYFERGKLLFEDRRWEPARRDFRKALKLNPKGFRIGRWIGDTYREQRNSRQAISWYRRTAKAHRKAKPSKDEVIKYSKYKREVALIYGYLGGLYMARGRRGSSTAIRYFRWALRNDPKGFMYHRHLGYLFKDRRAFGSCRYHLRRYLKMAPADQLVDRREVENDLRGCR